MLNLTIDPFEVNDPIMEEVLQDIDSMLLKQQPSRPPQALAQSSISLDSPLMDSPYSTTSTTSAPSLSSFPSTNATVIQQRHYQHHHHHHHQQQQQQHQQQQQQRHHHHHHGSSLSSSSGHSNHPSSHLLPPSTSSSLTTSYGMGMGMGMGVGINGGMHHQYHSHHQATRPVVVAPTCKAVILTYHPPRDTKSQLKESVFVSKDATQKLAHYVVKETWGTKQFALLYKYLDYIFRCQVFSEQVIEIRHPNLPHAFLCFHTGLQRKVDNEFLYGLFIPNNMDEQAWRVPFGPIGQSFLSQREVVHKLYALGMPIHPSSLPKRTQFMSSVSETLFDATFRIEANWEERLNLNKDRIHRVMGNLAFFDEQKKYLKTAELVQSFRIALAKTAQIALMNPRVAVPQGFVDTTNGKFRMELLLPVIIDFPSYRGKTFAFALAIGKSREKDRTYVVKSILTLEMAYANARLVGYVDSLWLTYPQVKLPMRADINEWCVTRR